MGTVNWRDEAKHYEQQWMNLKDEYSDLARIILTMAGYDYKENFWGDPLDNHAIILEIARQLQAAQIARGPAIMKM